MQYFLNVHQIQDACVFELRWGQHERYSATVPIPKDLLPQYQQWKRSYLNFYRNQLRGRSGASGAALAAPVDWHSRLIEAEGQLLSRFHYWLRSAELFEIRETLQNSLVQEPLDLFLTCSPLDVARLPWEAWELGSRLQGNHDLRIVRTPTNLGNFNVEPTETEDIISSKKAPKELSHRPRILIILGDDTGLDLTEELEEILKLLAPLADVVPLGWRQADLTQPSELRQQVCNQIASPAGWDILFFAGHSNESRNLGGQIGLAPNVWLYLDEILPYLKTAKQNGLKFALFNSCQGLDIAESFLSLGLGQVAIMREAIHHRVALVFLKHFLLALSQHQTVQVAVLEASQALNSEYRLTYPSAALIPSLFLHPAATPYQIPQRSGTLKWRNWLPQKKEALWLSGMLCLSLIHPIDTLLLESRTAAQALYRQATLRVPQTAPPVLLVQIDDTSLKEAGIYGLERNPIPRAYLAQVLSQVKTLRLPVIGIDYILDRRSKQPEADKALREQINNLQQNSSLVIAAASKTERTLASTLQPQSIRAISSSDPPSLQVRYVSAPTWMMEIPETQRCTNTCPFAHQMALNLLQLERSHAPNRSQRLQNQHLSRFARWSAKLGQNWFQPVLDFSIPPEQVYQTVSARNLSKLDAEQLLQPIVMVAPGGYLEAGDFYGWSDNEDLPLAISYWRMQSRASAQLISEQFASEEYFTGAEAHAYMVHHFLDERYVTIVPACLFILLAAVLGRVNSLWKEARDDRRQLFLALMLYTWISLEAYISLGLLLPWLFPILIYCFYNRSLLASSISKT